jgi:long-chain acyl-CoA synthetase
VSHTKFGRYIPGSPGWPQPGWEVKIVGKIGKELPPGQVGELWCKGPGVIGKYWKDPLATKKSFEDGWWKSGDLAYIEASGPAAGTVHIVDRKDDMIVCGGYNIYPSEVQSYLAGHPKILQAIVVGIPDEVKVEIPKAFIVLKPGQQATEQEIITWAKTIMAAYKAPRKVEFVSMDDLPQTATGKILKRELRSLETKKNSH